MARQSARLIKITVDSVADATNNEISYNASSVIVQNLEPKISRKLSEATRAQVVELHEAGKPQKEISSILEVPTSTVFDIIRRLRDKGQEFAINPIYKPIVYHNPQTKAKVNELDSQGATYAQIAMALKISHASIKNIFEKVTTFGFTAAVFQTWRT